MRRIDSQHEDQVAQQTISDELHLHLTSRVLSHSIVSYHIVPAPVMSSAVQYTLLIDATSCVDMT